MDLELKLFISITSALVGSFLGFLTKSYFTRLSFRNKTVELIVKRYLDARDEICSLVASCAIDPDVGNELWLRDIRISLSLAYYKYFDYIPNQIIQDLTCLQACLRDPDNHLYQVKNRLLSTIDDDDLDLFCKKISSLDNLAHGIYFSLNFGSDLDKKSRRIECQARHTLIGINKHFTESNLTSLNLFKPKSNSKHR